MDYKDKRKHWEEETEKKTNAKTMANDIQKRSTIIITVVTATTENTLSQIKSKTLYPHRHQRITWVSDNCQTTARIIKR